MKYPLESKGHRLIEFYKDKKLAHTHKNDLHENFFAPLHYIREFFETCRYAIFHAHRCEVFIGVDPLNSLAGTFLRLIGVVKKNVYFSADYAIDRFTKPAPNFVYHFLDRLAMRTADQTWSVSKRIVARRKKLGLSDKRNLLMPNAPFFGDVKRLDFSQIRPNDIVLVSAFNEGIAFDILFKAVRRLKKEFPKIRLLLIGSGAREEELQKLSKKLDLQKNIVFLGSLSHEKMFEVLVTAGAGIALYTNANSKHFRYFSDPMKVRDYLAAGLPAIVSGNSSIGAEIVKEKAGFLITPDVLSVANALRSFLSNRELHKEYRNNAILLAEKYDTYTLISNYFSKLNVSFKKK